MSVETALTALGLVLPEPARPLANYVPYVVSGTLVSVSGQIPLKDGKPAYTGKVGESVNPQDASAAARLCALNIIAQLKAAAGGDLERIARIIKLGGFVNSIDGFTEQPQVINAASDLMVAAFGEARGRHSRSAVSCNALPLGVPVEIDALAEIAPEPQ